MEVDWNYSKSLTDAELASVMKSNGYNPMTLIDAWRAPSAETPGWSPLMEVDWNYAKSLGDAELAGLMKAGSYKPLLLLDAVAQKATELESLVPQDVQGSRAA